MMGSSKYKWYVLTLGMLTYAFIGGAERMCMPVLFKEISVNLNLSLVAIGTIWGMDPLAGVFMALLGGMLADRFQMKRVLAVVCILAGVFGALRGLSVNFASMAASTFLFGLMVTTTPSIVPKTTVVWFKGRQLELANALLTVSVGIGMVIATMFSATVLSPLLGGWRNVIFLFGAPAVIIGLLWAITGREPPKSELSTTSGSTVPFRQALSRVVRIKEVWIIGLIYLLISGNSTGVGGYLPLYLRNIGWTPVSADSAITLLNGTSIFGAIPTVLLSYRLKARKAVLITSIALTVVSIGLLPLVQAPIVWGLLVVNGFMRMGMWALFVVLLFEMKGIGRTYAGTAYGLTGSFSMLGSFLTPPLGNSLAEFDAGYPFFFWALLASLALPLFFFIKERERSKE